MNVSIKVLLSFLLTINVTFTIPHIEIPEGMFGIGGLFTVNPEAAKSIKKLVAVLLRGQSPLAYAERELIVAYVSSLNECESCCNVHSAAASHLLDGRSDIVNAVKQDFMSAPISDKLKSLLAIAGKVQKNGRQVTTFDVSAAKEQGATDQEIHDVVLMAAVFCMNNRYVTGLSARLSTDPSYYDGIGKIIAEQGYNRHKKRSPHIALPGELPGIVGLLAYRPETAQPLTELAQVLLRNESTLSAGERELIASYVSSLNECTFCCNSHSAAAQHLLDNNKDIVDAVKQDFMVAPISDKLKALLVIAGKVQKDGRLVTSDDVQAARDQDATDKEIHDAVLIAAAFCMYNRYVDGLATWAPTDPVAYDAMGKQLAEQGYLIDHSK